MRSRESKSNLQENVANIALNSPSSSLILK